MLKRLIVLCGLLLAAAQPLAAQEALTVFAAASMKNALDDANAAFTKATGVKVTASYAASSALAKQIEQGAPADVFVSADLQWMDYVAERKLIKADTRVNLLGNRLVLIAASDSKLGPAEIKDGFDIARLAGDGRIAVADRALCQGGAGETRRLEGRRTETGHGRERARHTRLRRARRNAGRHRLRDRRQGRIEGEDHRRLPGRLASAGHLPGGGDGHRQQCGGALSCLLAFRRRQGDLRKTWLQRFDQAGVIVNVFDLSPQDWIAVQLSLRVALVATLVALPFGVAVAYVLARKNFWGKSLLDALVHLPLVLPPVVTGYLLLITLGRRAPVGSWLADHLGIVFSFRWTGAALACGVMAFPLVVRPIRLSIEAIDRRLEDASRTLGANGFWVFLTVTLPLALPGIIAGGMLGFAKALGEFGATITFVSNIPGETQTISAAIYTLTQVPDGDRAAMQLVLVSIVISVAALMASEWLARRAQARLHGA
jgi:molybdate transport system permease protein